jgi:hypothetical protein
VRPGKICGEWAQIEVWGPNADSTNDQIRGQRSVPSILYALENTTFESRMSMSFANILRLPGIAGLSTLASS